jgi:hypothetical protein
MEETAKWQRYLPKYTCLWLAERRKDLRRMPVNFGFRIWDIGFFFLRLRFAFAFSSPY